MEVILSAITAIVGVHGIATLTIALLVSTIILAFLGIKSNKGLKLSIGSFNIQLGGKGDERNYLPNLISSILNHQEKHLRNIFSVESSILKRQVNYADQKIQEIRHLLSENYANLLEAKLDASVDVRTYKDYKEFQRQLSIMMIELRDNFLTTSFVDNHFDTYGEREWQNFCEEKSIYLINYIRNFLDSTHNEWSLVSRKEASREESKLLDKIRKVFYIVYEMCKEISITSKKEIEALREESEDEIREICKNVFNVDLDKKEVI